MNQSITANFGRYLQDFLTEYLPLEKNASQNTISSYRDTFKLLLVFMSTKRGIKPTKVSMSHITKKNLISFLQWLEDERNCSIRTRNQRLAAIRSFLSYTQYNIPDCLFEIQKIQSMPTKKAVHREICYLTPENLKILLSQPDNTSTKGLRDCMILTLMYDGGLRVQELVELKWEDLRLSKTPYTVCVVGKGKKRRTIPLSDLTGDLLKSYKEKACLTKNVFVNPQGQQLTRKGVTYILDKYVGQAQKVPDFYHSDKITCHVLRHTKATHMLQAGIPLIYIRDFLGHNSVVTTEIYARINDAAKFEAISKLNASSTESHDMHDWNEDTELMKWLSSL